MLVKPSAVRQRRVGAEVLEPPADVLGVAHVDLADLARRELATVGVEDADVGAVAAAGAARDACATRRRGAARGRRPPTSRSS